MAGSTALRLASGLLLFVVLARVLGVAEFGRLMMWFAIAALIALPTNFGLSVYLLREVPLSADRGASLLVDAVVLKVMIASVTLTALAGVSLVTDIDTMLLWPLALTHLVDTFTDLLCAQLRAGGAFSVETRFVTRQSLLQFLIIALVAWSAPFAAAVAWSFLASRIISLMLAISVVARHLPSGWPKPRLTSAWALLRKARAYFADFGVQSSLIQVDVVLLGHFAGATAVGLYQAAMRVGHGISQAISVLVNVLLPRLSKRSATQAITWRPALLVTGVFSLLGGSVALPLYFGADFFAAVLYGDGYSGLPQIFQVVALFLFIRFLGAAAGVLLIACGDQGRRAIVMLLAVLLLGLLSAYCMPRFGAIGAVVAMCGTYAFIAISFALLVVLRLRAQGPAQV